MAELTHPEKVKVMLVDDHLVLREAIAVMIDAQPDMCVCGQADGLTEAQEVSRTTGPLVALVDLSIRDGDGLALLRYLKAQHPAIRAIVLSMYDESVYADRAQRAGAVGYLSKSRGLRTVIDGIRKVAAGGLCFSSPVSPRSDPLGLARLSDRELQVLRCIGVGMAPRQIGEELTISVKTVEAHREHIKQKLGLAGSSDLIRFAIEYSRIHD